MNQDANQKKAIILLSGGLDSATTFAIARDQGYQCYALSFDYGQRSRAELAAARQLAAHLGAIEHRIFTLDMTQFGGSALTDHSITVPTTITEDIPITYVPARNTIFLSIALAWAEVLGVDTLFIGANAVDYSGYPDCRPEYIDAFAAMANLATKAGVEGQRLYIETPLMHLSKADIIKTGLALNLDYAQTCSCYKADFKGRACGECDSCRQRAAGFQAAGVEDPTRYIAD